jgi:hypothetical protein
MANSLIPYQSLHVDKNLTNYAIGYKTTRGWSDNFLRTTPVAKQSDLFPVFSQADLWRRDDATAGRGAELNRVTVNVSSDAYLAKKANADDIYRLETNQVEIIMDKLKMDEDIRIASLTTNTSNVGCASNVASSWSDYSNSDPFGDVNTHIDHVHLGTGYRPNTIVFGVTPFKSITRNNKIINKIRETGVDGGGIDATLADLARLFNVERCVLAEGFYNSGEEGQALSLTEVFGDHVFVGYIEDRPNGQKPTWGTKFRWQNPNLPSPMAVQRIPMNMNNGCAAVQAMYYQDEKVVSPALGNLISWTGSSQ